MLRLTLLALLSVALLAPRAWADDEPAPVPKKAQGIKGLPVIERDPELRRLLSRVRSHRAEEEVARVALNALLETKTEKHPKVVAARGRLEQAQGATGIAHKAYQDARKAKGLPHLKALPELSEPDRQMNEARADVEFSRAQLRMYLDQRAVVEEELKAHRSSKTDKHPKVRSARTEKGKLDAKITAVKARIAREQEHVAWLERRRDKPDTHSVRDVLERFDQLQQEIRGLRADVDALKALLKQALEAKALPTKAAEPKAPPK